MKPKTEIVDSRCYQCGQKVSSGPCLMGYPHDTETSTADSGEPLAWAWMVRGRALFVTMDNAERIAWEREIANRADPEIAVTPLYAHPQASEEPKP